jgi:hypothetical protein
MSQEVSLAVVTTQHYVAGITAAVGSGLTFKTGLFLKGEGLNALRGPALALLVPGLVILGVSISRFRKRS